VSDRPPDVFVVKLRALAGRVPAVVRLRGALKVLLRSFGLKCIAVEEAAPPAAPGGPRSDAGGRG
jgi:hypothetical protein